MTLCFLFCFHFVGIQQLTGGKKNPIEFADSHWFVSYCKKKSKIQHSNFLFTAFKLLIRWRWHSFESRCFFCFIIWALFAFALMQFLTFFKSFSHFVCKYLKNFSLFFFLVGLLLARFLSYLLNVFDDKLCKIYVFVILLLQTSSPKKKKTLFELCKLISFIFLCLCAKACVCWFFKLVWIFCVTEWEFTISLTPTTNRRCFFFLSHSLLLVCSTFSIYDNVLSSIGINYLFTWKYLPCVNCCHVLESIILFGFV